jgi:hypothetical protein
MFGCKNETFFIFLHIREELIIMAIRKINNKLRYNLRITDENVMIFLEDLLNYNKEKSINSVLNTALKIGVYEMYNETFKNNNKNTNKNDLSDSEISKGFVYLESLLRQNAVALKISEKMLTILFNLELYKLADDPNINMELLVDGSLDQLPDFLERTKINILNSEFNKTGRIDFNA